MLHIYTLRDYRQFGIHVLTGEACGYGLRMLCDLTESGRDLVTRFLGGVLPPPVEAPASYPFNANWNSGAVASCMLPRSLLFGELAVFAMFNAGCMVVVRDPANSFIGISASEGQALLLYEDLRNDPTRSVGYQFYVNRSASDRNTHAMTGRTE